MSPCEPHGSSPGPRTSSLGTETGKGRGLRAGASGFPGPLGKASLSLTCGPSRSTGALCNGRAGAPPAGRKLGRDPAAGAAPRGAAAAGPGAARRLPLTFPGDGEDVVAAGQRDAEVVVLGEAAAVQHVGPGEAEGGHHRGAALLHLLAERVAGLDDLVQVVDADGGEEGAEELPGVGVALLLHQRDPGGGLLQHLLHRLMPQQVGQPHALVLDAPAQQHRGGDGLAVGALVGEVGLPEGEEPGGRAHALGRQ